MAYFDTAATAPMLPEALEAYVAAARITGNPSSIHAAGRKTRQLLETARGQIAQFVGADPAEVIFTGGGTESINTAISGAFWQARDVVRGCGPRDIVIAAGEHHATTETADWLGSAQGASVREVPIDGWGRISASALRAAVSEQTAVVSFSAANNEVGTVQDIPELVAAIRAGTGAVIHVDAVAALGRIPVSLAGWGVDAISVAAHKIGGPTGIGALLLRRSVTLTPVLHGGGQERHLRSGTVDVPAAVAFGVACEVAGRELSARAQRLELLRDRLQAGLLGLPGVTLMGDPDRRLPDNVHVLFSGCDGDSLLFLLDQSGYQVSTGSACTAGVPQPSAVLRAMGIPAEAARGALRFTLGSDTDTEDVDGLLAVFPEVLRRARSAGHSDRIPHLGQGRSDA